MGNAERIFVLVHGSPGDATGWEPLLRHAPAGARCEAWDLVDHGSSPDEPGAALDDVVSDVVARVRALGRPVTLVGHSFGGWVGGRVCALLGDQVERFVAIAGLAGATAQEIELSAGLATSLETGQLSIPATVELVADLWLPKAGHDAADVARLDTLLTNYRLDRLVRGLRRLGGLANPAQHVQPFAVPTLGISCSGERGIATAKARELAALSTVTSFVELEGDSHFPHWTHTAQVAALVFD